MHEEIGELHSSLPYTWPDQAGPRKHIRDKISWCRVQPQTALVIVAGQGQSPWEETCHRDSTQGLPPPPARKP